MVDYNIFLVFLRSNLMVCKYRYMFLHLLCVVFFILFFEKTDIYNCNEIIFYCCCFLVIALLICFLQENQIIVSYWGIATFSSIILLTILYHINNLSFEEQGKYLWVIKYSSKNFILFMFMTVSVTCINFLLNLIRKLVSFFREK